MDGLKSGDLSSTFLVGGGPMGARMRTLAWEGTPLGPPALWPQQLRTLVEVMLGSGQPMFVVWGSERITLYNDGYARILGAKHPWALGRPFAEVWADIYPLIAPYMEAAYAGQPTHMEDILLPMVDRRGFPEVTHFSFSYTPVRDEHGTVVGMFCACSETTEMVFATGRLRFLFELNDALRGLSEPRDIMLTAAANIGPYLAVARVGYAELLADDEILAVECEWTAATSTPAPTRRFPLAAFGPEVVKELRAGRLVRIDDTRALHAFPTAEAMFAARGTRAALAVPLMEGKRLVAIIYAQQEADRRWREDEGTLLRDVGERTWEAVGRARSVAVLREGEARLRLLDQLGQASRTARNAQEIMAVNTRVLGQHLGVTRCAYADVEADGNEFAMKDWTDGAPSSIGRYALDSFGPRTAAAMHAGRTLILCDVDAELSDGDGAASFRAIGIKALVCCPLIKGGQLVAMMAVHSALPRVWKPEEIDLIEEVVERSWAHIERARAEEKLREQDARKDEFLATLAHELRNPLAPLRTGLAVLERNEDGEDGSRKVREMMGRQLGQMVRLIDDLLDVSRVSRGFIDLRKSRIDLNDVIAEAAETSMPLVEARRHRLEIGLSREPLTIQGDATRLVQVVSNLLNNAAKYTPEGGTIAIYADTDDGEARVRVVDSGIGIPPAMLREVFEMFRQVGDNPEHAQSGLGIGLTLARRLAVMHGGTLSADSAGPGHGSTFTLRIPLEADVAPQPSLPSVTSTTSTTSSTSSAPSLAPAVTPLKVLVVDDNVDGAEMLSMMISMYGHEVASANTGPEALTVAETMQPDVIFLDIGLPGLDGYEVARQLRLRPNGAAVVLAALTGWGSAEDKQRARAAGFDHHLTKPVAVSNVEALLALAAAPRGA